MFASPTTRALIVAAAALVWGLVGAADGRAWAWPSDGAVLREFSLGDNPYAAGQHRGIDVGLGDAATVRAPASGEVTFAGTVPTHGLTVTIATADGHKASLTHLGALLVRRGDTVVEGVAVAEAGPSGDPEHDIPYVHLGVRAGDGETYVDPEALLPARAAPTPPAPPAPAPPPVQAPTPAPTPPPETAPPAPAPPASEPAPATEPPAAAAPLVST
ncbi:MAG: murein hydrolase activator EnvC family protein, partial [Gaiellaceae bacterium]